MTGALQTGIFDASQAPHGVRRHMARKDRVAAAREVPALILGVGTNHCQCMGCREYFNSVAAFDLHQRLDTDGRPVCVYPGAMTDRDGNPKPMVKNARGWWVTRLREYEG
jgi:hypothetical protein